MFFKKKDRKRVINLILSLPLGISIGVSVFFLVLALSTFAIELFNVEGLDTFFRFAFLLIGALITGLSILWVADLFSKPQKESRIHAIILEIRDISVFFFLLAAVYVISNLLASVGLGRQDIIVSLTVFVPTIWFRLKRARSKWKELLRYFLYIPPAALLLSSLMQLALVFTGVSDVNFAGLFFLPLVSLVLMVIVSSIISYIPIRSS